MCGRERDTFTATSNIAELMQPWGTFRLLSDPYWRGNLELSEPQIIASCVETRSRDRQSALAKTCAKGRLAELLVRVHIEHA